MTASPTTPAANTPDTGRFRQAMAWLHTWSGLTLGWILLFIFITGTAGYFDTEIDRWMRPEMPIADTGLPAVETAEILLQRLEQEAPGATRWFIGPGSSRNAPYPLLFWQGASLQEGASAVNGELPVNTNTGEPLEMRETGGGQLLYRMHWKLHYLPVGLADLLVGSATLFMLLALLTGVIVHKKIFKEFFTFRPSKGRRSWLDAHNLLSVVALPFHLMITYSGLVFMGVSYMPLVIAAYYGTGDEAQRQFFSDIFDPPGIIGPADEAARLVSLNTLVTKAESLWGEGRVRGIDIRYPGDRNARIIFYENAFDSVTSGGRRLVFNGVSGELLHHVPVASSTIKGFRDLLVGLHEGLFAPSWIRWLYFISGLLSTAMIATGLVLWSTKRRQRIEGARQTPNVALRLVEKLNVAAIIGLPTSIAAYFWSNRLLPANMPGRAEWEVHLLFLTWLGMLVHAALRPTARAWQEQAWIAAVAFALLPIINTLTTDRHLAASLAAGDWVFAGFDLTMLLFGFSFTGMALYLTRRADAATSPDMRSDMLSNRKPGLAK